MREEKFDDGTTVEWSTKDALLYRDGDFAVSILYRYGPDGIFEQGRKIVRNAITKWEKFPAGASADISLQTKEKIIQRAIDYFMRQGMTVEVVDK